MDVNAAINILKLALSTAGHAGTYAWGDLPYESDWSNRVV
jgi:putative transposase